MTLWMVEYTYDSRAHLRDQHRPAHRAYLSGLVETGHMAAFGRFDDAQAPGALLIVAADSEAAVNDMLDRDPFVIHGLVPERRVRQWAGTWGAIPAAS